ncbi:glutaminase liver isoform, mitochondrial isoform X2 [Halyomorpha halys]|nr:glutaminase liver isoform, mitochondrial isoform X2 [Halyomorpha halys]
MKRLRIEDFPEFSEAVEGIYESLQSNISGHATNEFPDVDTVDVNTWGVAICSIDGQRKFMGHSNYPFTMQSICKPLLLAHVLKTVGMESVHKYIDFQPNNVGDNILELNLRGKPFNSMANSGAIMLCALLTALSYKNKSASLVHEAYVQYLKEFIGDEHLEFKASAFISKMDTADELRSLSYGVACSSLMPSGCDTLTCLDLYIKACSMEVTVESLSLIAATMANGGINPLTEERVINSDDIKEILSAMYSYGVYQYSGESSFMIGLPMKSSTNGALIMVVPDKMGVALYSPLLNEYQISERSFQFCKELVNKLKLHRFDIQGNMTLKKFPNRREKCCVCEPFCELFSAAAADDVNALTRLLENKADFYATDFFGHNLLHIAAAKGCLNAVKNIVETHPSLITMKDKWGRTPKAYAYELKFYEIVAYIERLESLH